VSYHCTQPFRTVSELELGQKAKDEKKSGINFVLIMSPCQEPVSQGTDR